MTPLRLGYVNFFVSDFERSLRFFRDVLELPVLTEDEAFGYASFDTGPATIALQDHRINRNLLVDIPVWDSLLMILMVLTSR